ncbi:cytosine/adenosine deaminase-related metal-dependent hydrolase [Microbacterium endophyticum]|uniref:Cytosine/adenosine deaminase-related metal-dependent hydrolase n=1 Tax=Microbacterium endophyticum TaxID=1526412 RepID=A0A7W4YNF3_9MICO|nr:amidohydrolase family protein [Microbacterium endophyticum]MBB2977123.1 cytosine/adenosine deaminase-related metal-dependent hydrolase [Microbacterium endophyticum]NIK36051.1 cytosine/adenosine deaminase-related metal-dependent hydrolase [Microbacterium endophyticum]
MSLLVINARLITIPAGTDDPGYIERGWMLVEEGRITGIGEGDAPETSLDEVLDVNGAFVAPGFVSSHSHLFTSGLRGLGVADTLYGWCDSMLGFTSHMSAEDIYWSTLHGALDFLSNGVTTAYNFTDPLQAWESMVDGKRVGNAQMRGLEYHTRQADGCADAGIRFVDSIGMDATVGTDDEIFERFGASVAHTRGLNQDLALGASIMGQVQWSPREDAAEIEVAAMRRFGVTNQAHFLESPEAVELQQSKFAMYRDAGALGPDMMFGHFIQTTPEIIAQTAASGASMSWQPASNGRLASGVALVPEMIAMGMKVGMGLDDQACTDVSDPWQNMRLGIYMQRARTKEPLSMMPELALRLHTLGGAEIMSVDDRVGSLEVGKFADFVVVDPRQPDMGPLWHPVRNYVLSSTLRNLTRVYVGGELVSKAGASTNPLAAVASARIHNDLPAVAAHFGHPH